MAVLGFIKGRKGKDENSAQALLTRLDKGQQLARVELETTPFHFQSTLSLSSGAVKLQRPIHLEKHIGKGMWVRIRHEEEAVDLRLQISSTQTSSNSEDAPYFMCRIPGATTASRKRGSFRYSTLHYKNLRMELPGHSNLYRIMDISQTGIKILVAENLSEENFPVNQDITHGTIHLGKKARVRLQSVTIKHLFPNAVGMIHEIRESGTSKKIFEIFLDTLESHHNPVPKAPDSQSASQPLRA